MALGYLRSIFTCLSAFTHVVNQKSGRESVTFLIWNESKRLEGKLEDPSEVQTQRCGAFKEPWKQRKVSFNIVARGRMHEI
jgi:hypothetical protein